MKVRSLFAAMFGNKPSKEVDNTYTRFELLSSNSNSISPWNGRIFDNDIVRSCLRPISTNLGKLNFKYVRNTSDGLKIIKNGQIYYLLKYPNAYMTMQKLLEKLVNQYEIEGNAYAYVKRDDCNNPIAIFPIPAKRTELKEYDGELYMKFTFSIGKHKTVPYCDVIHLRKDFNENDIFGTDSGLALQNIMKVLDTTDKGVIQAIKNSAIIKWMLKFKTALNPKDKEKEINKFAESYLDVDNQDNKNVAATDPRYDAEQVKDNNFVPNEKQMESYTKRLYSYFGVNEKIVNNSYSENEWNAFYESKIEPIAREFTEQLTKILFTKHELECGNEIVFEPSSLQFASMSTKLSLVQMVDRNSMTPNEWRKVMNLGPIENGDKPLRRLDTAVVNTEDDIKIETVEGGEKND